MGTLAVKIGNGGEEEEGDKRVVRSGREMEFSEAVRM